MGKPWPIYPSPIPLACLKEPDLPPVIAPQALSLLPLVSAFLESLIVRIETGLGIWVRVWLSGSHMSNRNHCTVASRPVLCRTCCTLYTGSDPSPLGWWVLKALVNTVRTRSHAETAAACKVNQNHACRAVLLTFARCIAVTLGLSWFTSQSLNHKIAKNLLSARYEATNVTPKQAQCKSDSRSSWTCGFEVRRKKVWVKGKESNQN